MFFSPLSIGITSLGKRANLGVFRTFVRFALVCLFVCFLFFFFVFLFFCFFFPLPLGVWEGLRLVIVALSGLFSYLSSRRYLENHMS